MQVTCEHCGTGYELEASSISGRGARITCPACSHVFVVYQDPEAVESAADDDNFEIEIDLDGFGDIEVDLEGLVDESEVALQTEDVLDSSLLSEIKDTEDKAIEHSNTSEEIESIEEIEELSEITNEEIQALEVTTLNFADVGIKSWKVKKSIGLMFEYSDFKTFMKSWNDGRINGDDHISPDGKEWVSLSTIEDFEHYFCKIYLEFEQRIDIEVPDKKVKEKVVQPLGGMNELATALAAAQAEVEQAQKPSRPKKSATRKRPSKKSSKAPPPSQSSNSSVLSSVVFGVMVLIAGWWFFGRSEAPPPVVAKPKVTKPDVVSQEETDQTLEAIRAELKRNTEKIEEQRAEKEPEPEVKETQLMVKVPDEILAQQKALQAGKTLDVDVPKEVNHINLAQEAFRSKSWDKAITHFQKAYKQTKNPEHKAHWGHSMIQIGKVSQGRLVLIASAKEGAVSANKWLGYLLREEGDIAGSNQHFNSYLQSSPKDASIIKQEMMKQ
jgi:predicted Zn finger-like uncharacterized protein